MARQRRTSSVLEITQQRLAGLKKIKDKPDFGDNLNALGGDAVIADLVAELDSYNQNYALLDEQQNLVDAKERMVGEWGKRVLQAVGARYGTDSSEYEMVGGTRTSERKKPKRKGTGGSTPAAS